MSASLVPCLTCNLLLMPFDTRADGTLSVDSVCALVLRSDGWMDKAGYLVPSPVVNLKLLHRLHGSGIAIGNAFKLERLTLELSKMGVTGVSCVIGSNKGNLGNCKVGGFRVGIPD
ncbi:hypothetical protein BU17DRAFT_72779 [Hysterangium stoloniferum]|nr:hypothetical protein BU17DRAFT_72779 [Hysterangium stoloniferum]